MPLSRACRCARGVACYFELPRISLLAEVPIHGVPSRSARPRFRVTWLSALLTEGNATRKLSSERMAWSLEFVALLGDVPVAAASLGHLGRLLPPAFGVAFHPHVHKPLRASFAAPRPTRKTALSSSSAPSAHSAFLLVALPP